MCVLPPVAYRQPWNASLVDWKRLWKSRWQEKRVVVTSKQSLQFCFFAQPHAMQIAKAALPKQAMLVELDYGTVAKNSGPMTPPNAVMERPVVVVVEEEEQEEGAAQSTKGCPFTSAMPLDAQAITVIVTFTWCAGSMFHCDRSVFFGCGAVSGLQPAINVVTVAHASARLK